MRVLVEGLDFPEGPAFDPDGGLWCTEGYGGNLIRWEDGGVETHDVGGVPNAMAFDREGEIWICDFEADAVVRYDPDTRESRVVADAVDGGALDRPNDLAFDAEGNLVFTCSGDPDDDPGAPTQYVCCLGADGGVERVAEGLVFPNGLAFASGGTELVVAETYEHRLLRGDWDAGSREWTNVRPWADVGGPVGPDGMAVGADERVYVAVFGRGRVEAVAPDGEVVAVHRVPGSTPTNVAFDPSGELGLVVTETERGELLSLPDVDPGADWAPFLG